MDMQEIMSTTRDLTGLMTEGELGVALLKRYTNMAQDKLSQLLMTLMSEWLVKTIAGTGVSVSEVALTGDMLMIMDCTRATIPCERVPVEHRPQIGRSVNHPGTAEFPAFVHEGAKIIFYPVFGGGGGTAYTIRYRKRLVPMIEGAMTYASAATVTLSPDALAIDDFYNDYQLTLYLNTGGVLTAPMVFRITEYVGATKVATVSPATVVNQTTYGALWSLIPAEYHNMIIDTTMWFLAKAGRYKKEAASDILNGIMMGIQAEMGITVPVREKLAQD